MKKSFTLMEVIISTALLSVVMLSLFQAKNNSIFILEKSQEAKVQKIALNLAVDTKDFSKRVENIYLDRYLVTNDDEIRREFKKYKIRVKEEILDTTQEKIENIRIGITKFKTNYSFENGISTNIYKFELKL